jgi:hypothetical protein
VVAMLRVSYSSLPLSRGSLTPSTPRAYSSLLAAMFPSLSYLSLSSSLPSVRGLSLSSCSPNVFAWLAGLSHPPSITPACFWLVVACKILNGSHLRPLSYLFCNLCCCSICHPERRNTPPLYTPPWHHIPSIILPIAAANYWLIVVSYKQTAAT